MSLAYYNEHDPYAAAWLRNLIAAGHIAPGVVDERDLRDVRPEELIGFTQCHFFAGIGVWPYALRRAGISDDQPLWSGSCPCQPFSAAGRAGGFADERHLWPHWHWLISQCRPELVLGEQVASKDGLGWLDLVSADMEGTGYAFGAVDLCAAGFQQAHLRQRLYFVGLADSGGIGFRKVGECSIQERGRSSGERSDVIGLADVVGQGLEGRDDGRRFRSRDEGSAPERMCPTGGLGNSGSPGLPEQRRGRVEPPGHSETGGSGRMADSASRDARAERQQYGGQHGQQPSDSSGLSDPLCDQGEIAARWLDVDWLLCRNPAGDPSWRPVEPRSFPLAHGATARVGRLRAYGNALDAETAFNFCQVVKELTDA